MSQVFFLTQLHQDGFFGFILSIYLYGTAPSTYVCATQVLCLFGFLIGRLQQLCALQSSPTRAKLHGCRAMDHPSLSGLPSAPKLVQGDFLPWKFPTRMQASFGFACCMPVFLDTTAPCHLSFPQPSHSYSFDLLLWIPYSVPDGILLFLGL